MKKLFFLIFLSSIILGQRADFFREDITFRIDSNYFDVEGYYWFTNHSDKSIRSNIYYPFPNSSEGEIDSIRLFNISAGQQTNYNNERDTGISFNMYISPHDTVLFQIGYRQKLKGDSVVYILKTTKAWNKPIDLAEYKLIIPASLLIKEFSYTPDKYYEMENQKVYYWKKENFMPESDMVFYF